jgi:Flp pilus assembly protein TadG
MIRNLWHRLGNTLRALRSCATGAAAAEFAVIVPVMGLLLSGTMDLARMANQGLVVDAALRAGAGYALADPTNETAITNYIKAYASFPGTVTVSFCGPGSGCSAPTDAFAPPQFCTCDNGAGILCDNSKATCTTGKKHFYEKIQVTETVSSLVLPLSALAPNCPSGPGYCATRTLTARVQ